MCVCVFQILACVFVFEMQKGFCWVIQLFSLVCTVKGYYDRKFLKILELPYQFLLRLNVVPSICFGVFCQVQYEMSLGCTWYFKRL